MGKIITISRQYGSGGSEIGRKVAKALSIPYYDRTIIDVTAKESGFDPKYIERAEQTTTTSFLYNLAINGMYTQPLTDQLFSAECRVIKALADKGPCVIVGRCADYILRDKADCLRVFIHADMKFRAERIVKVYGEREASPEQRLKDKDKRRAIYHRFYTNMKWGHAQNYDITLNSGTLGIDTCVSIIKGLY